MTGEFGVRRFVRKTALPFGFFRLGGESWNDAFGLLLDRDRLAEPAKYWVSTLPPHTKLKPLVKMAKHRWLMERDYEELKQELGLGHYEGRGWRGFHHHATLCIAAYGFLIAERNRFSPSARVGNLGLSTPKPPPDFQPRGSRSSRAA